MAAGRRTWARYLVRAVAGAACLVVLLYLGLKVWQWCTAGGDAPRIGVSFDTAWHARTGLSTKGYEVALTRAGAQIVELDLQSDDPSAVLNRIDALLLTGGGDIDPKLYGGDPKDAQMVDPQRDQFELALIEGALARDMPILGICRGIQILNVARGGALRNLRDDAESASFHGIQVDSMAAHDVEILADTKLAALLGSGRHRVNSFHGQAVGRVAPGLTVSARASDGVVEALAMPDRSFVVATQWHPEIPPQQMEIFQAFVEAAKLYRSNSAVDQ